jgi:hypothetical protein
VRWIVNRFAQVRLFVTSLTHATVTLEQLFEALPPCATKLVVFVARVGTAEAHCTVTAAGQLIVGGWLFTTVTVKLQLPVLPEESVAVQVTVLVPVAKDEPLAGAQVTLAPPQLSLADGVV